MYDKNILLFLPKVKRLSLQGFGLELIGTKKVPKHNFEDFVYDMKVTHTQKRGVREVKKGCFAVYDKSKSSKKKAISSKIWAVLGSKVPKMVVLFQKFSYYIRQIVRGFVANKGIFIFLWNFYFILKPNCRYVRKK